MAASTFSTSDTSMVTLDAVIQNRTNHKAVIAGAVVAATVIFLVCLLIIYCFRVRRKKDSLGPTKDVGDSAPKSSTHGVDEHETRVWSVPRRLHPSVLSTRASYSPSASGDFPLPTVPPYSTDDQTVNVANRPQSSLSPRFVGFVPSRFAQRISRKAMPSPHHHSTKNTNPVQERSDVGAVANAHQAVDSATRPPNDTSVSGPFAVAPTSRDGHNEDKGYVVVHLTPPMSNVQDRPLPPTPKESELPNSDDGSQRTLQPAAPEIPNSVEGFQHTLQNYVQETHLELFFKDNQAFLDEVAKNANILREQHDPLMQTAINVERLTRLTLYQLVMYCDDSGSMHGERYETQKQLVTRITRLATKILPPHYGVELHFINSSSHTNMTSDQAESAVAAVRPSGTTKIGTNLRSKILDPLIYRAIQASGGRLERPFLMCCITDGCPTTEPPDTFKESILECKRTLADAGYNAKSAMFCISQIGDDEEALKFLRKLRDDPELEDVLYCTSDRLDEKFKEFKDNELALDEWLLHTLATPIMLDRA